MTLALSRVRRNSYAKQANQNLPPLVSIVFLQNRRYNPPSRARGLPPRGRSRAPTETRPKSKSLHSSASAQMDTRGLLSRVSIRGTLTDARNETIRTQDEGLDSTLWPYTCAAINGRSLEDGNNIERIDQGSSTSYRRIWERARAKRKASSAGTMSAA